MRHILIVVALLLLGVSVDRAQPAAQQAGSSGGPAVQMIGDTGEAAKYWARWRGPSGQGMVSGTGYVDTWSATQNVVWKTPVPGSGNSSPIVWANRIYLTTAADFGSKASLLAFDRTTGKQVWEAAVPAGDAGRTHDKNGFASATAVTDGQRIYAAFGSRGLKAVDMNGMRVWHVTLCCIES